MTSQDRPAKQPSRVLLNLGYRAVRGELKKSKFVPTIGVMSTLISDLFQPIHDFSLLFSIGFIIILVVCLRWLHSLERAGVKVGAVVEKDGDHTAENLGKMITLASFGLVAALALFITQRVRGAEEEGALASTFPEVKAIQARLLGIDDHLVAIDSSVNRVGTQVHGDLQLLDSSVTRVKQETSEDPRKELQNMGVSWSGENFLNAVKEADARVVSLFLQAGIRPEAVAADGRPLPIMLALNTVDPDTIVALLAAARVDLDHVYKSYGVVDDMRNTLIGGAIDHENDRLLRALLRHGADPNVPYDTYAAMGFPKPVTPLRSAIYWQRFSMAYLLLDAGCDISADNYGAYEEALRDRQDNRYQKSVDELDRIAPRIMPPDKVRDRIEKTIELEVVESLLVETIKEEWSVMAYPEERAKIQARIDELRAAQRSLRAELGLPEK